MLLNRKDLGPTAYQSAAMPVSIRMPTIVASGAASVIYPCFSNQPRGAKQNFESRLSSSQMPSAALVLAARAAMNRIDAREAEDVDTWAEKLGNELGLHTD